MLLALNFSDSYITGSRPAKATSCFDDSNFLKSPITSIIALALFVDIPRIVKTTEFSSFMRISHSLSICSI